MSFWERITGRDITRQLKDFEPRINKLPDDYQDAWKKINVHLWQHSDFSGRNLLPVLEGVLNLLEEMHSEGLSAREALGDDIKGFCTSLTAEDGLKSYRDTWRERLNNSIAKKLDE